MDLGVISLVLLLLAIILGFFRKTNVGLVSLLFALILGRLAGMNDASILKGFNPNLFIKLMGVTFSFQRSYCERDDYPACKENRLPGRKKQFPYSHP